MSTWNRTAKFALAAVVLAGGAASALAFGGTLGFSDRVRKEGPVWQYEVSGEAYHFDALWRVESLWRHGPEGWTRVSSPDSARMDRMRARFLARARVASLQDIPVEGQENVEALKSLGYL